MYHQPALRAVGHGGQFNTREKAKISPGTSFQFPLLHTSVEADATEHGDWGTLLLREEVNDASSDISWPEEPREHC